MVRVRVKFKPKKMTDEDILAKEFDKLCDDIYLGIEGEVDLSQRKLPEGKRL